MTNADQPKRLGFMKDGALRSFVMNPPLGPCLEANLLHEQFTSFLVIDLLRPGDTVIDAGANAGYYSVLANAVMNGTGQIFAFEPNPVIFTKFMKNIVVNKAAAIRAFNVALSDRTGTAELLVNADDSGLSRIVGAAGDGEAGDGGAAVTLTCATMTLDDVWRNFELNEVRLLKIDVEGHEKALLQGAANMLRRRVPEYVICEINRGELLRNGCNEATVRATFETLGYDAELINAMSVDLCGGGRTTRPYPLPDVVNTDVVFNLLFRRR